MGLPDAPLQSIAQVHALMETAMVTGIATMTGRRAKAKAKAIAAMETVVVTGIATMTGRRAKAKAFAAMEMVGMETGL